MNKKVAPPPAEAFTPRDVSLGVTRSSDTAFPLRWGILGTGEICRQFVCAAREVAGATMAGASSRHAQNAHAFASVHVGEVGEESNVTDMDPMVLESSSSNTSTCKPIEKTVRQSSRMLKRPTRLIEEM